MQRFLKFFWKWREESSRSQSVQAVSEFKRERHRVSTTNQIKGAIQPCAKGVRITIVEEDVT